MRDDFKASMAFLLSLGFLLCIFETTVNRRLPFWAPPTLNLVLLCANCLLLVAKYLNLKLPLLTQNKFLICLFMGNCLLLGAYAILAEQGYFQR